MRRTPIARTRASLARRTPIKRLTPLRARPSRRARPDEPLATWCAAQIEGVCTGRATDRHHLVLRSQGGTDDTTADICRSCHGHIHAHPAWAYEAGWLRRKAA